MTRHMKGFLAAHVNGAEVIINAGPWCRGNVGGCRDPDSMTELGDGIFDEMFGSFSTVVPATGAWDVKKMQLSFDRVINMTRNNGTVFIHAFPGPAGTSVGSEGMFPVCGNTTPGSANTSHVSQWAGSQPVPGPADTCRAAAAKRPVAVARAPFLIATSTSEPTFPWPPPPPPPWPLCPAPPHTHTPIFV
jgi:hypothetical protein